MKFVADNIGVDRGVQQVVRGISFSLDPGQALVVTGENGTGKSTLLRALAGLLPLAEGTLRLEGLAEEAGNPLAIREQVNYLGPGNAMKAQLSVGENLTFWRDFAAQRGDAHMSVKEALDFVELLHTLDLPFGYLSTGMKRRVAIARLLICDRPLWIVDEPTSGLDARSCEMFSGLCRDFCADGGILVAATHLPLGLDDAQLLEIAHFEGISAGEAENGDFGQSHGQGDDG